MHNFLHVHRSGSPSTARPAARRLQRGPLLRLALAGGLLLALGAVLWLGGPSALAAARPLALERPLASARPLYVTQLVASAAEELPAAEELAAEEQPGEAVELPENQPAGGQPAAAVSADFYNFGRVGPREVVRGDFLLYNNGSAALVVQRAYTTCGCTTAEISGSVIAPGEAARVTLVFDAGFHPVAGQTVRRGLVLETNDPRRGQVEIWVQAEVANR